MSVLVVGSVALDDIETPVEVRKNLLGGSASYGALAASFFSPARMVGIVGDDFPGEHVAMLEERGVDISGLRRVAGKTFRWSGKYHEDMNSRDTISVALNVFENFRPDLPDEFRQTRIILLANIAPDLQHLVLDQSDNPQFVIVDTMDLWIEIARSRLLDLLGRVDMLILNDSEARQLTGESNLVKAGRGLLDAGPSYVAIKKGEHGCLLMGPEDRFFSCPAYPIENLHDPTGAGDTFAGGLAGFIAAESGSGTISFDLLRRAIVRGSILASFNVEAFSLERLREITSEDIDLRLAQFRELARLD
jgi:cytidine kinase